jgi:formylglycine-generating enzyme required for sulfatase activity
MGAMELAAGQVHSDGGGLPQLVVVPAGRFLLGSPEAEPGHEDCESPQREIAIARPFALGRTAVTFAEWDAYAVETGDVSPADEGWGRDDRPVVNVSWHDAQRYVAWLRKCTGQAYRLPSEAEWEYAARAGTTTAYHWGDMIGTGNANCVGSGCGFGGRATMPVARFAPNAFGLYDMLGNVWEWVEDCWNEFHIRRPLDGTPWRTGDCERRVLRGGSWCDPPRLIRTAARNRNAAEFRCNDYGFRVARDL